VLFITETKPIRHWAMVEKKYYLLWQKRNHKTQDKTLLAMGPHEKELHLRLVLIQDQDRDRSRQVIQLSGGI
jgi:hypothetical protein